MNYWSILKEIVFYLDSQGHSCCDRMVVCFTTTNAIGAYHHWCCWFESRFGRDVQHYVIKFVSDLLQVNGFLQFPLPIKLTHEISEILLKVALSTIKPLKPLFRESIYIRIYYWCLSIKRKKFVIFLAWLS